MDTVSTCFTKAYQGVSSCATLCINGAHSLLDIYHNAMADLKAAGEARELAKRAQFIKNNTDIYGSAEKAAQAYEDIQTQAADTYREAMKEAMKEAF